MLILIKAVSKQSHIRGEEGKISSAQKILISPVPHISYALATRESLHFTRHFYILHFPKLKIQQNDFPLVPPNKKNKVSA